MRQRMSTVYVCLFQVFLASALVIGLGEVKYRKGYHRYALLRGPYFFSRKADISRARKKL